MPISVGVNLLWLRPGEVGGSEESTLAGLRALARLRPPDLDVRLFVTEPLLRSHPDLADAFPTEVLPWSDWIRLGRAGRILAESTWLADRTRRLDLVHHAGGTAPLVRGGPYVLTIHDLQPLERRATHGVLKRAYLSATVPPSVRRARLIAVPSDFVRRSVLDRVDVDAGRVVVVPHGIEPVAAPTPADVLVERYSLDGPVVLYPAITYPHKNHAVLVEAFAGVVARHPDALLVLTGGEGSEEERLRDRIDRLGLAERVRRLGRVSTADVAGLYRAASVVAVPSRYEGFGLPAAEAMAYGAPLVAARSAALPEVVGEAGLLVAPGDVGGWAAALNAVLEDPVEAARLGQAGLQRVGRFSWAANAEAMAGLYRAAL